MRGKRRHLIIMVAAVVIAAFFVDGFAAGLAVSPWPREFGNNKSQIRSNYTGPTTATLKWKDASESNWQVPLVDNNGTLYYSNNKGIAARDNNGNIIWRAPGGTLHPYYGALTEDGNIFTSCDYGSFMAVTTSGQVKWRRVLQNTSAASTTPAIGNDGTIYTSLRNVIYAINPDGTDRWQKSILVNSTAPWLSTPTLGDDGSKRQIGLMNI